MVQTRFSSYTLFTLGYNIFVILWGAYVRATGSGAGCGSHWPTCQGAVIPRSPSAETLIEFTHRLTSGIALLLVLGLVIWAYRSFPPGSNVRRSATFSAFFIILEALLGAGLVLFELVAQNDSLARAISMAVHLANTFLLLGALALTAWWASGGAPLSLRRSSTLSTMFVIGFIAVLILGMSGAITALGDTLFPSGSLAEGVAQDFSPTAHFLIRLRVIHPVLALLSGVYLLVLAGVSVLHRPESQVKRFSLIIGVFFTFQLIAGVLNVFLLAPVWLQIVHLLLADLVWVSLVMLFAATLAGTPQVAVSPLSPVVSQLSSAPPDGLLY